MNATPETSVCLAQMRVSPGDPRANTKKIIEIISQAAKNKADLVVFPEMAVPGYLIGDAWERPAFLRECEECGKQIREAAENITVIFGNIGIDWTRRNEDGRVRKYNALFVAENREFISPDASPYDFVPKTLTPNYREFDDSRHFFDTRKLAAELGVPAHELIAPVRTKKLIMGCVLCEDAWDVNYGLSPLEELALKNVDLYINISCSPFTLGKRTRRVKMFSDWAARLGRPFLYVNSTGIQNNGKTVFTFDGGTCAYDTKGKILPGPEPFSDSVMSFQLPFDQTKLNPVPEELPCDGPAEIYQAVLYGTREFMKQCGISKVTVGISGGIDSAVVAAIYSELLEPENLLLVNMPGQHNSATTINLARDLARNAGCFYAELPIQESVNLTFSQINGLRISGGKTMESNLKLTEAMMENVQARDRSSRLLAAVATAFGGVFTCNSNKTEATVGYTTLYGDLCGFMANIADLWKGEVYQLAEYINRHGKIRDIIPEQVFAVKPSAELGPHQNVDENKGDPLIYPYHDRLFAAWVENWNRITPEEILEWHIADELETKIGFEGRISDLFRSKNEFIEDLEKWWRMYQGLSIAKRIQAPPILALKRRAFGFDHRESLLPVWFSEKYIELKRKFLAQ